MPNPENVLLNTNASAFDNQNEHKASAWNASLTGGQD